MLNFSKLHYYSNETNLSIHVCLLDQRGDWNWWLKNIGIIFEYFSNTMNLVRNSITLNFRAIYITTIIYNNLYNLIS